MNHSPAPGSNGNQRIVRWRVGANPTNYRAAGQQVVPTGNILRLPYWAQPREGEPVWVWEREKWCQAKRWLLQELVAPASLRVQA